MAKKKNRAQAARRGTKADTEAAAPRKGQAGASGKAGTAGSGKAGASGTAGGAGADAAGAAEEEAVEHEPGEVWWYIEPLDPARLSKREQLTKQVYTGVGVVLVISLLANLAGISSAAGGLSGDGLNELLAADPSYAVLLVEVCLQVAAVWLLNGVYESYRDGNVGRAFYNLVVLLVAEFLMSSVIGVIGIGVLLWRSWHRCMAGVDAYTQGVGLVGKLGDIAFSLLLVAGGAFCTVLQLFFL